MEKLTKTEINNIALYYCSEWHRKSLWWLAWCINQSCLSKKYYLYRKICQWVQFVVCYENYFLVYINQDKIFHLVDELNRHLYIKVLKYIRKHKLDGGNDCLHLEIKVHK